MILLTDAPDVIAALKIAADTHLAEALRQRHVDVSACGIAMQRQMRAQRIARELERAMAAPVPTVEDEVPMLCRRQADL